MVNITRVLYKYLFITLILSYTNIALANHIDQVILNLKPYIKKSLNEWHVPGAAIAIVTNGEVKFMQSYGLTQVNSNNKVNNQTLFRIASLSKSFTAALLTKLHINKQLNLNNKIIDYMPNLHLNKNTTIQHLLSHQTGILRYAYENMAYTKQPLNKLITKFRAIPYVCSPGNCYQYQNVIFSLTAPIIEKTTGQTFQESLNTELLLPLNMLNTTVVGNSYVLGNNVAQPHSWRNNQYIKTNTDSVYHNILPAGGIVSNITDMATWLQACMGYYPQQLNHKILHKLYQPKVQTKKELTRFKSAWRMQRLNDAHYGLGWRIYNYAGTPLIYHSGAVSGYSAVIAFAPNHKVGIVILTNSRTDVRNSIMARFMDLFLKLKLEDWSKIELDKKIQ